jgi:hypothetical protein
MNMGRHFSLAFRAVGNRLICAFALALLALAAPARADTWFAQMERAPTAPAYCPDVPIVLEMSTQGAQFSGRLKTAAADYTFSSPIGPGGEVSASFAMKGTGTTTVSGNAGTKTLQMTSVGMRDCVFLLKPTTVAPGAIRQWKATMQQTSGNTQVCQSGERGAVTVIGESLFFFQQSWVGPIFGIKVRPDGSADIDTMTAYGRSGPRSRARVKVAAGTGPREVQFVTYNYVCGYKIIPD